MLCWGRILSAQGQNPQESRRGRTKKEEHLERESCPPPNRKGQDQEAGGEWLQEDSPAVGSGIVSFGWAG